MTADASDSIETPRDLSEEDAFLTGADTDTDAAVDTVSTPAEVEAVEETDELSAEVEETDDLPAEVEETGELPAEADLLETYEEGEGEAEGEEPGPREPSPYDRPGEWFVVHTYAGYENKVKSNL